MRAAKFESNPDKMTNLSNQTIRCFAVNQSMELAL